MNKEVRCYICFKFVSFTKVCESKIPKFKHFVGDSKMMMTGVTMDRGDGLYMHCLACAKRISKDLRVNFRHYNKLPETSATGGKI